MQMFYDGGLASGMSLRDYLAGQALAGLLASCAGQDMGCMLEEQAAEQAYAYADALLARRRETSGRTYKLEGGRR